MRGYQLGGNFERVKLDQSLSKLQDLGLNCFVRSRENFWGLFVIFIEEQESYRGNKFGVLFFGAENFESR